MKKTLLWLAAVVLMVAAAVFQRMTGPTYPYKGSLQVDGADFAYRLIRSSETTGGARVVLPDVDGTELKAQLHYRRYPTHDTLRTAPFLLEDNEWAAYLPVQPAAGKMEYFITLNLDGMEMQIPEGEDETIILRYKDPVPLGVLLPHVIMMFLSMLIGVRAGLAAVFRSPDMKVLTYVALAGMTLGGMILGPIVQKYAFDAYWTGFPFGGDLTDNKTLIMWGAWILATVVLWSSRIKSDSLRRGAVVLATAVMMVVYLIPHSLRGSELDYQKASDSSGQTADMRG